MSPSVLRLPIRVKLLAAFGAVVAMTVALGLAAIGELGSENAQVSRLASRVVPATDLVGQTAAAMNKYRKDQLHYILSTPAQRAGAQGVSGDLSGDLATMASLLSSYRSKGLVWDATDKRLMSTFARDFDTYVRLTSAFRAQADQGRIALAGQTVGAGPGDHAYDNLKAASLAWETYKGKVAARVAAASRSTYAGGRTLIVVLLVLAVILAVSVALVLSRRLSRGIEAVGRAARRIGRGELDQTVDVAGGDELADMAADFNGMAEYLRSVAHVADRIAQGDLSGEVAPRSEQDQLGTALAKMTVGLRSLVGSIHEAASTMSASTQQIAASSESAERTVHEVSNAIVDVAHGNERQVQAIEQARRVADQVAEAAASGAAIAQDTAEAVERARTLATGGAEAVTRATEAMEAIRASSAAATDAIAQLGHKSDQIGGIVRTITEIAEQTNLLALNAAIEAARAGEQGRGFAVVAEEVRKLAEGAQEAAASIGSLIGEIQSDTTAAVAVVQDGTQRSAHSAEVVEEARDAFLALGSSVDDMSGRVREIASVVAQIAASAQEVHESMAAAAVVAEESSAAAEEVSASAQETSASTQQFAGTANELARAAGDLADLVARFQLVAPAPRA